MPLRYLLIATIAAFAFSLALVVRIVYTAAAPTPGATAAPATATQPGVPELIADPSIPPVMAEGPGRDAFMANCLNCHSPRYVTMQPRFSRKVWTAEVAKMVTAYKAPIAPAQQAEIVDYLAAAYGAAEAK